MERVLIDSPECKSVGNRLNQKSDAPTHTLLRRLDFKMALGRSVLLGFLPSKKSDILLATMVFISSKVSLVC